MNNIVDIQQLAAQLELSIRHYERIQALLVKMDLELGPASPVELREMDASLAELQQQANVIDRTFLDQLTQESTAVESIRSLLDRRATVIDDIIKLNGIITAKAAGVQSLLAHELGTLRSGISALKGYKQQEHGQGRIVNSTS